ncbi:GATA transcription factor 26-like protein [Cinnamomum micranthum f. kanehirae]|uniref:GATA transcription factor 26-like protein n=1 Tax=Cinnamomum micranthum f. kanehirae TaxID=337451 RepID=A0A3S3MPD9_9MAGN|nr:GATA transcription factor 26-like protein [Cinnamomum micranthum f. kanehirae]
MGKQGPCYHCGVTNERYIYTAGTPLWRNGPPEKPVLCNACGSRWRTKGTLANYTPLHVRAELVDSEDYNKAYEAKPLSIKTKAMKLHKRKYLNDNAEFRGQAPNANQNFQKAFEEDTSNGPNSGPAISSSESSAHFGNTDARDLKGLRFSSAQSIVWDSLVPSRKRTCVGRPKPSAVEKLTKDLYCMLHEQQLSNISALSEEELLLESGTLMDSVEIGHGGILIKHLNVVAQDEESEASSLPIDCRAHITENAYSGPASILVNAANKRISYPHMVSEKVGMHTGQAAQDHTIRNNFSNDKHHILRNSKSPLTSVDLIDIVCFEKFTKNLTQEEQQQLLKFLPSIDTAKLPDSLKSMFDSPLFVEALSSFQHLFLEGILDLSSSGVKIEECWILKRPALGNMTKSKWVEHYELLKDEECQIGGKIVETEINSPGCSNSASVKRTHDVQNQNFPEPKCLVKGSKRVCNSMTVNIPPARSPQPNYCGVGIKTSNDTKYMDNEGPSFSPTSLFAFSPDGYSITLDPLQFSGNSSNQDFLLDVNSYASVP